MRKHYGSEHYVATSSRSENYFKYIKENVLDDRQPTRADMFIIQHIQTILPRLIEARAAYDKEQMTNKKLLNKPQKVADESILNYQENWKNKNRLDENVDPDSTEEEISNDNSLNVVKSIKNNDNETKTFKTDESKELILNHTSELEFLSTPVAISVELPTEENSILSNKNLNFSEPKFHFTSETYPDTSKPSNIPGKENVENSFSIVFDEEPIKFKIHETQKSVKRKQILTSTPCPTVKRGKYVVPFPSIKVLHQNAAAKNSKKKKN
ncbi:unnamed protein product [Parnassius apollo]|uniref:(apollo) hypothetical protein n=1 Tax=Parnassius apollo TaxID=110799 RepID=A0A8S3XTJ3_PARAO|nr:unnamed protein product [Parnassius apollo]